MTTVGLPKLDQAALDLSILALLKELPNYWLPATDLADVLEQPWRSVARALARLAESGAIDHRKITWRSKRYRIRVRTEYRNLPEAKIDNRYPAWLEPALFPSPDPRHCRRISGRHSDRKKEPMNEHQYRALPRNVRECFSTIKDEEFANHPEVMAARQRLELAGSRHRQACETAHQLRTRKAQLEAKSAEIQASKRAAIELRLARLVGHFHHDEAFDADADLDLARNVERFEFMALAIPEAMRTLDGDLAVTNRDIQNIVREIQSAEEELRGTLDDLKLAEAKRRVA